MSSSSNGQNGQSAGHGESHSPRHGGSRPGAGRKPKALAFADTAALVEQKIAAALPDIIAALIAQAKNGDLGAARYLCDRILGRVATVETPPVLDTAAPPDEADWEHEQRKRAFERQVEAENLADETETRPAARAQNQNMMRLLSGLGT
jgi:hypothetical protein